jgi:hypothetical protein
MFDFIGTCNLLAGLCLINIFWLYPYMVTNFVIAQRLFLDNVYWFHDIPSRDQSEGKLEDALGYMEDDSCGQVYGEVFKPI